jgi:hypothetical protein
MFRGTQQERRDMAIRILLPIVALLAFAGPVRAQDFMTQHRSGCDMGDLRSCTVLGLIYETGAAGVRDVGRALELYGRACAREVQAACLRIDLVEQDTTIETEPDPFVRVGRVADAESGAPLDNALVDLPGLDMRRAVDEWGRVDLGRLPRGVHTIIVRRLGYEEVRGELPVPWDSEFVLFMYREVIDESVTLGTVFGQVTDAETGEPLANVEVVLLSPNPVRTMTNPQGRFSFGGVAPGTAEVRLNLLGYEERRTELDVTAGRTTEVYAALSVRPIELEPIEVVVASEYLDRTGFYRRARAGSGYLLTRRDLQAFEPMQVEEMFLTVPGVATAQMRWGAEVVTRRQTPSSGSLCHLRPYLDGMPMMAWDVNQVRPEDVEGIEVYQGVAAPIEYQNLIDPDGRRPCGVVLIWTTRGGN